MTKALLWVATHVVVALLTTAARADDLGISELQEISESLRNGEIDRLEIVARPFGILSPGRVDPRALMIIPHSHCEVFLNQETAGSIKQRIERDDFQVSENPVDIYWRIQFYDRESTLLSTLYLGRSYETGPTVGAEINGEFLVGGKSLVEWFESLDMQECESRHR